MMRLAMSNIAWKPAQRHEVYALLAAHGARGLEIAPSLAFSEEADPFLPSPEAVSGFLREVDDYELQLVSMQSLLYGVADAQLFGTADQRECFRCGMQRAVDLAGRLGIPNLVMGSPGNRVIPDAMPRQEAERIAINLLRRVGDECLRARTTLALEPNAAAYGTNFLTSVGETIEFLQKLDHPAVKLNYDLGALHMNDEMDAAASLFARAGSMVSHVHVSEPQLAPAPRDVAAFASLAGAMQASGYQGWFSIEMRAADADGLAGIERAVADCAWAMQAGGRGKVEVML